jgi:hypothetical protein
MIFFFKCTHEMIVINNNLLPTIQNRERATAQDLLIRTVWCLQQKKARPQHMYQKSFLTRSTRVWNILPKDLTDKNITFNGFKSGLLKHYKSALRNVYNAQDPRTWKLYVCLVIRLVACLVPYRAVVSFLGRKQNSELCSNLTSLNIWKTIKI